MQFYITAVIGQIITIIHADRVLQNILRFNQIFYN
jgi:hypothetical protein